MKSLYLIAALVVTGGSTHAPAESSVVLRLITPAEAHLGNVVRLRLELRNTGTGAFTLNVAGWPAPYDFVVTQVRGAPVWNWRQTQSDTIQAIIRFQSIGPGEVVRYDGQWDLRDRKGRAIKPGLYYVRGVFPTHPLPLQTGKNLLVVHE